MLYRARELERFLAHPLRPLRIAQLPKSQRQIAAMRYPRVLPDVRRPQSRAFTIVVVRESLFILGDGAHEIAPVKQRQAQEEECLHPDARVVEALSKIDRLSGQFHGQAHLATDHMPSEIAPHHGEELWRFPYSFAQLARMHEDRANLRGCVASHSDVGRAERTCRVCNSRASRSSPLGKPLSNARSARSL